MTFAACVSFYNDARGLQRLLNSIAGNFEYIFCLDGRFNYVSESEDEFFRHPLSTDGSRRIVDWYRDKYNAILLDYPDLPEPKKRQAYTDVARTYGVDCILIIDSDEYVWYADWEKFRSEAYQKIVARDKCHTNIYNIACRDGRSFMDRPRLWFRPWELAYGKTHYEFYRRDDPTRALILMGGDEHHFIDGILVRHDQSLRKIDLVMARLRQKQAQQEVEDFVEFGRDGAGFETVKHSSI